MTAAGQRVQIARYRIPTGERALHAQRIDGRVALIDIPVDHDARVYLVERHLTSHAELHALAAEYARHSQTCGLPGVIATQCSPDDKQNLTGGEDRRRSDIGT